MKTKKTLAVLLVISLLAAILVQPVLAGEPGYKGGKPEQNTTITGSISHETGDSTPHEGTGNPGDKGQGGKGGKGDREDSGNAGNDSSEEDEDGSKGKGGDNKGGVNKGGGDKGKGGRDDDRGKGSKGGVNKPVNPGKITLTVEVKGLGPEVAYVDITLSTADYPEEGFSLTEPAVRVDDSKLVAVFVSEASGDCILTGADVPGYITPSLQISLTGDEKTVTETMTYIASEIGVEDVTLNVSSLELVKGYSEELKATVLPKNASNQAVTWNTTDANVATISENGMVRAVGTGTCVITVTTDDGAKTASCNVKVIEIVSLVNPAPIEALKDELVLLPEKVIANMSEGPAREFDVAWKDESGAVVTAYRVPVNISTNSEIYFHGDVTGTIEQAIFKITVLQGVAIPVVGVTLNKTELALEVGMSESLIASIIPASSTNPAVEWSSDKPTVAAVDANGNVTAVSVGSAVITVTTADGGHEAYCMVSVTPVPEPVYIFAADVNGLTVDHFESPDEVYINVKTLVEEFGIEDGTEYNIKVEQKGDIEPLSSGKVIINEDTKVQFHLIDYAPFEATDKYHNEYYVSMSTDPKYPKNDDLTLKTNFKIGSAVPTVPEANVTVNVDVIGGYRDNDPEGIIFLLCRELDEPVNEISWEDYCTSPIPHNPYATGIALTFSDEVKMKGTANEDGLVIWEKPRETLKLGGYLLLEVTPLYYVDNLNMVDPASDDGALLKEVHLVRDGSIQRDVTNIYTGNGTINPSPQSAAPENISATDTQVKASAVLSVVNPSTASSLTVSGAEEQLKSSKTLSKHWAKQSVLDLTKRKGPSEVKNLRLTDLDEAITADEIYEMLQAEGIDMKTELLSEMLSGSAIITRQQVAVMMMLAFNFGKAEENAELGFKDSNEIEPGAKGYIIKAVELGILKGCPDKTLKPGKAITRAEFYTILSRCLKAKGS